MRQFTDMFRPNYDTAATISWAVGTLALVVLRPPFWQIMLLVSIGMALLRGSQAKSLYKFWLAINSNSLVIRPIQVVIQNFKAAYAQKAYWLGYGFIWDQGCAERALQITVRNASELKTLPKFAQDAFDKSLSIPPHERNYFHKAIAGVAKSISPGDMVPNTKDIVGNSWIHGLSTTPEDHVLLPLNAISGHTLILGTTGAGKTRLYEVLSTQFIHAGKCLIVFDPKKDVEWRDRLKKECERSGRKFLNFDLARPSESVRIDPLANFNNISEVGARIAQLVDADGSFAAFASKTLSRITVAMAYIGVKPNIRNIRRYVMLGVEPLATTGLEKYLFQKNGADWDRDLASGGKAAPSSKKDAMDPRLEKMVELYLKDEAGVDAIDGLVAMLKHSKEHYSKMVQVLEPILELLGSGEVGALLSPDYADEKDLSPIYNFRRIIEENAVLYVGLDSLSNGITAQAVGSIFLADLAASAGAFYNLGLVKDVYLILDEAGEVVNDQTTQLLNKGRGAGFKLFLATQTLSDFVVRYGSKDKAMQALGNLNNLICLRLKDMDSAQYASDVFGLTETRTVEVGFSTGTESSAAFTEFRGQTSRSLKAKEIPLVATDLLLTLSPMHYFAFFAGKYKVKGRLPLIMG
jgi:conjugal transfer pilus assembly protein TraD